MEISIHTSAPMEKMCFRQQLEKSEDEWLEVYSRDLKEDHNRLDPQTVNYNRDQDWTRPSDLRRTHYLEVGRGSVGTSLASAEEFELLKPYRKS